MTRGSVTAAVIGLAIAAGACRSAASDHSAPAAASSASPAAASYAAAVSHPRHDPYYPAVGTTSIDTLHYGLDLAWDAPTRTLSGTDTIRFRATRDESKISLDMGAPLSVSAVTLDGAPVTGRHSGNKLDVLTGALSRGSRHTVAVTYSGTPQPVPAPTRRRDIPDLGWTITKSGQAWALQEPYGAFTWYPVNDHPSDKAFYDITWHTQANWSGVSNGDLVSNTAGAGQHVMHWRLTSPAASYLVTVGIGPYHAYHQTGPHGLPITYWVRKPDTDVLPVLRRSPAMLRWLEARLGRFPFDRIGDIVVPTDSGEETQTLVTIGPDVLRSRSIGPSDLLHEYSHQWYGDEVSPNNWPDLWMNESFAMYIQIRWEATHHVESMGAWRRELYAYDQRLRRNDGPPGKYKRQKFAELNVYFCGARMLDRLHFLLGEKQFAKLLRRWPAQHRNGNAVRAEWIHYLDRRTGHNYGRFVHRWLDDKKSPR